VSGGREDDLMVLTGPDERLEVEGIDIEFMHQKVNVNDSLPNKCNK